jgi:hypothetical protein
MPSYRFPPEVTARSVRVQRVIFVIAILLSAALVIAIVFFVSRGKTITPFQWVLIDGAFAAVWVAAMLTRFC